MRRAGSLLTAAAAVLICVIMSVGPCALPAFAAADNSWAKLTYTDGTGVISVSVPSDITDQSIYFEYKKDDGGYTPVFQKSFDLKFTSDCTVTVRYCASGKYSEPVVFDISIPAPLTYTESTFGITLKLPSDSGADKTARLSATELIEGPYYLLAAQKASGFTFMLIDTALTTAQGGTTGTGSTHHWTIPLPARFSGDPCVLYSVSDDKKFTPLLTEKSGTELTVDTDSTGMFLLIDALEPSRIKGDIDADGSVTSQDARLALRYAIGLEKLTAASITAADVDGDGSVTAGDARLILRFAVGLITRFN